ncbi:MAG: NADP-dependent oxidoreductase [Halomonadaceae bacterium]|nr:MAG: NADP-dependent oxidoreductase [Halomonadaceae bacterium]
MRKVILKAFGDADELTVTTVADPEPGPGEVRLVVHSAGINPIDWKTREGLGFVAQLIKDRLPWTPGFDAAGIVEAVGPGVSSWAPGDGVVGMIGFPAEAGAYAEKVLARADALCRAPEGLSLKELGGVPLAALTAWQGLFNHLGLHPDQKVLIQAGAGGVGHFAVQFAKLHGAHVIATASGENEDFLKELGADEVIDYQREDVHDACYGLDAILDLVGGDAGVAALNCLGEHGRMATVPTVTASRIEQAAKAMGRQATGYVVNPDVDQLDEILALMARGEVHCHIAAAYPLKDAPAAQRRQAEGHVRGKLILQP